PTRRRPGPTLFPYTTLFRSDPLESLAAGKIEFTLHGEKLQGGWKLVRTQQMRSGKPQWLLFKRDDEWAGDLEADDLLDGSGKARGRKRKQPAPAPAAKKKRARRRRVDWAARAAALEGARPKPRSWKPPGPQLATLRQAPPEGDDWLHELKWDGYRLLVEVAGGEVKLRSRNGLDWTPDYPDIVQA